MEKIKFNFFRINFNSYYPHAYEIQRGNYIHYLPKTKKENTTDISKILNRQFNPSIIITSINLKRKFENTSTIIMTDIKEEQNDKVINNLLKNIDFCIRQLKEQGLTKEEIETQIKNILYIEKENPKQKVKTP